METDNKIERFEDGKVAPALATLTEEDRTIRFSLDDTKYSDIMVISKGKFYWKGQEVEDVQGIYEKVCAFFHVAYPMNK
jgi:hypothetical protein